MLNLPIPGDNGCIAPATLATKLDKKAQSLTVRRRARRILAVAQKKTAGLLAPPSFIK
jgi:hypothetical protein